jgi:hypothetical protein
VRSVYGILVSPEDPIDDDIELSDCRRAKRRIEVCSSKGDTDRGAIDAARSLESNGLLTVEWCAVDGSAESKEEDEYERQDEERYPWGRGRDFLIACV